jgi:hypothetical protein
LRDEWDRKVGGFGIGGTLDLEVDTLREGRDWDDELVTPGRAGT